MSKHEKYTRLKRQIGLCLAMGVALFSAAPMAFAATSVVANNQLPTNGTSIMGNHTGLDSGSPNNPVMNIHQTGQNGVIKWESFNVGGSATVNFTADVNTFNTLNYVTGGDMSQIYGTINATGGNIYIVNPSGVQIGNSAQINVGSLYVSTNTLDDTALKNFYDNAGKTDFQVGGTHNADAELMSLGNINATNVTFEGDGRIVIDTERIKDVTGDSKLTATDIVVRTNDADKLILGYDAYVDKDEDGDGSIDGYKNADKIGLATVYENGTLKKDVSGYMWIEDVEQLQAIDTNLGGNYALRNSIDATATSGWSDIEHDTTAEGFKSIGVGTDGKVAKTVVDNETKYGFYGNFDGLDYNIFGLTINRKDTNNVGLFGVAHDANINNVTLVGGKITGHDVVGSVVGAALGSTSVSNATNSTAVIGHTDVGGIVGASRTEITNGDNGNITVTDTQTTFTNLINTGSITSDVENSTTLSNVGGLIGNMYNGKLYGNSYNLGNVSGEGYNVGGLVGHAKNSIIGNPSEIDGNPVENVQAVYNVLDVTGAYNVGGIVGNMENSTVRNAENRGNVTATGSTIEPYKYHKGQLVDDPTIKDDQNKEVHSFEAQEEVKVANVGGIVGNSLNGTINDVLNEGDISTVQNTINNDTYYIAGNVGGVVGRAEDTNITNATNKEANIRGAHNVGGIAGYFGNSDTTTEPSYTVTNGINNGGDILATSARDAVGNVVKELVRGDSNKENFNIGNMGGIVGYMYGDKTHITGSANRGTVHSADIEAFSDIKDSSKAANVGGIVGKIDRSKTNNLNNIKKTDDEGREVLITENIAVSNSYNTGDVKGFTGIGGVVGMMYNGEVAGSYNLGAIESTRIADDDDNNNIDPLNMGGVIGDATERAGASALIYDVYNKGQIGRADFETYGRHVGGVVGRLSGNIEKAYNNGAIYNGYTTTGGIAGWWVDGSITNVFNTGNITVYDKSTNTGTTSQVGGIAGAVELGTRTELRNAYNLGTIRSIKAGNTENSLGGIIGDIRDFYEQGKGNLNIENVYTMGNLYVDSGNIGSIIGKNDYASKVTKTNTYYIKPENGSGFKDLSDVNKDDYNKAIEYDKRTNQEEYKYQDDSLSFSNQEGNSINGNGDWRIYEGSTTPILNAFIPNTEKYFSTHTNNDENNISSIQYGTAYDPLLTIVNAKGDVQFDWQELGMSGDAGLAVYDGGLTLNNFANLGGTGFFGGIIYTDKALNINGNTDIRFGSSSQIYGSSVNISTTGGDIEGYGNIIATGNQQDSGNQDLGDISLSGNNINIYGTLQSSQKGDATTIAGIENTAHKHSDIQSTDKPDDIKRQDKDMVAVEDRYAHKVTSSVNGNITITANNGDANIYYGNEGKGIVDTAGDLTVNAENGNVYIDSDMVIGGDLNAKANDEIVVDISNVGKVDDSQTVHDFLHGFSGRDGDKFNLISNTDNAKITVDLWDSENGQYDFRKYDYDGHVLTNEFNGLNVTTKDHVQDIVYIWVADGEQMKAIQDAVKNNDKALGYNYALMGDINASGIEDYVAIGTGSAGFTGTFDGRGNRIIGLNVKSFDNAGIFDTVGEGGTVKDVNIYSGNFTGNNNAGAVAGVNEGRIEGVVTFGNTVKSNGNAGGIVGENASGTFKPNEKGDDELINGIYDVESTGSVIAGSSDAVAGGLVGTNTGGLANSFSDSAVTVQSGVKLSDTALGGVVGSNTGDVQFVDSLGVTNGGATGSSNIGGIIGINEGKMYSGYNESIVSGQDNVGGIIGVNGNANTVENVVNATSVDGENNVGGLVGSNSGSVTNGRNNGEINGHDYVGGLVGSNASADSVLTNLVNDSSASITGENFVGGIAGTNAGKITAANQETLVNRGDITGQNYVGGVAGENIGTIEYVKNDVTLHVSDENKEAQFFGGVAGINGSDDGTQGTITNATNRGDVIAENADYVGGIVGWNTANGVLTGMGNSNEGRVEGNTYVGGVAGLNNAAITGTAEEMVGITNSGVVIAHGGGAGGIFGVNAGKIEYAHISNTGIVSGTGSKDSATAGTGGLIGVNNGDIIHSSLTNELSGQVMGTQNVGGLIGINTGKVSGGRDAADSYYKYQVYNNGVVNAGTWNDNDGDGIVDEGEFAVVQNGQNIGGLVGTNHGEITAAYNTGVVNGNGSTAVGGIAGTNTGTIDQVFSTIFDASGKAGSVSGGSQVGGLVGANSGTLRNAYNTSVVPSKNGEFGTLVGMNSGTVEYAYTTADGNVFGANNGKSSNVYSVDDSSKWKYHNEYDGFDFDTDGRGIWKNYDGYGNPLLKVFLTKVTYNPDTGALGLPYTGSDVAPNIEQLIRDGFLTAPDDFKAHWNAKGGLIFNDNDSAVDIGTYWEYLWSKQIAFGNGSLNWLGYDLQPISYEIVPRPDGQQSGENWSFLYKDAPFDRNRDFRERKAEINFVDGGMEL